MRVRVIQSGEKPLQHIHFQANVFIGVRGPVETMLLKPFVPQGEAVIIPVENFDHVSAPVAENEQIPGKGIVPHGLLDQNRQPVDGLAHIGAAHGQEYSLRVRRKHHKAATMVTSRSSCSDSALPSSSRAHPLGNRMPRAAADEAYRQAGSLVETILAFVYRVAGYAAANNKTDGI